MSPWLCLIATIHATSMQVLCLILLATCLALAVNGDYYYGGTSVACRKSCVNSCVYYGHCGYGCRSCCSYVHRVCSSSCLYKYKKYGKCGGSCGYCGSFLRQYLGVSVSVSSLGYLGASTVGFYKVCRKRCVQSYVYNGYCGWGCGKCGSYLHSACSTSCISQYRSYGYCGSGCGSCGRILAHYFHIHTTKVRVSAGPGIRVRYSGSTRILYGGCARSCVKSYVYYGYCGSGCGSCERYIHKVCSTSCISAFISTGHCGSGCGGCGSFLGHFITSSYASGYYNYF